MSYNETQIYRIYLSAKSLFEGKGLLKFSVNADKVVVDPKFKHDKCTAMVLSGFALYGSWWPDIYETLGLKNNLFSAYDQVENEYNKTAKAM